jgi:predicted dehydrogenase
MLGLPKVEKLRVAVVGTGSFGRNHLRVIHQSREGCLAGVLDLDVRRAAELAAPYHVPVFSDLEELARHAQAAVVATPTVTHSTIGCRLLELGLDLLIEKPIAHEPGAARALVETAGRLGRILQVGHLERFNPAVLALESAVSRPLFFEVHRLSEFSPRSLDVDVVLDLMIHDIDIVLSLTGEPPEEIRAAGISILSPKVDIANVRMQFPSGCIANLTASRVSTERVRKLRLFQPHEYISLDYSRQDAVRFRVKPAAFSHVAPDPFAEPQTSAAERISKESAARSEDGAAADAAARSVHPLAALSSAPIDFAPLPVVKDEPLRLELEEFFDSVAKRRPPRVTGEQGLQALEVAFSILAKIEEHSRRVAQALEAPRQALKTK